MGASKGGEEEVSLKDTAFTSLVEETGALFLNGLVASANRGDLRVGSVVREFVTPTEREAGSKGSDQTWLMGTGPNRQGASSPGKGD